MFSSLQKFLGKTTWGTLVVFLLCAPVGAVELQNWAPGGLGNGGPVSEASISPQQFQFQNGNLWIADYSARQVRAVLGAGPAVPGVEQRIVKVAQLGFSPFSTLTTPTGRTFAGVQGKILEIQPDGTTTTIFSDGVFSPYGMAWHNGQLVVVNGDANRNQIVSIDVQTGTATVLVNVSGGGNFTGDNGLATLAQLRNPQDVTFDGDVMYISDTGNNRIRKVENGIITTVAGGGFQPAPAVGDGGPAVGARLYFPQMVRVRNGEIFIADKNNNRVRKVRRDGIITTIAGTGSKSTPFQTVFNADPLLMNIGEPNAIEFDTNGNLFIGSTYLGKILLVTGLDTATPTATIVAALTPTETAVATATVTLTLAPATPTPTWTWTPTGTKTSTPTHTRTYTPTSTWTPTPTATQTEVPTYTPSPTFTPTETPTSTPTNTKTSTAIPTETSSIMSTPTPTVTPEPDFRICDVTRNGSISSLDASWVLQSLAGLRVLSDQERLLADATGNGRVSALDATAILQVAAGIPPNDPHYVLNRCGSTLPR